MNEALISDRQDERSHVMEAEQKQKGPKCFTLGVKCYQLGSKCHPLGSKCYLLCSKFYLLDGKCSFSVFKQHPHYY